MRTTRALLAVLVASAVTVPLATPAAAAPVSAAGAATSSATLVELTVLGHTVELGTLSAVAQTVTSAVPTVTVVPVTVDGVKAGTVTVDPSSSPRTVGGTSVPVLPANVLTATSPSATLRAASGAAGPSSGIDASLGSLSLLGMPVTVNGNVSVGSVTDGVRSQAGKRIQLGRVALPSVADLLAAAGVDVGKLPVGTLESLLTDVPIALSGAVESAAELALAQLDQAQTGFAGATTSLQNATGALSAAQTDATAKRDAFVDALDSALLTEADWNALPDAGQQVLTTVYAAEQAWIAATGAVTTAQQAVTAAEAALAAADALLDSAVAELRNLVEGVLGTTPLAEIGGADVSVVAHAGATRTANVTGTVTGIKVLNNDVLDALTGSSSVDAAKLLGDTGDAVNAAIADVVGALSDVLSSATGATGLVIPAPEVSVMKATKATGADGAFGTADATVSVLDVAFGAATIPTVLALPEAAALPGVTQQGAALKTAPFGLRVASVKESARFRPAVTAGAPGAGAPGAGTPGTPDKRLPSTGGAEGVALAALVAAAGAGLIRRAQRRTADEAQA